MKTYGLQTFIWKNNFRSLFLLAMFPMILMVVIYLMIFSGALLGEEDVENAAEMSVDIIVMFSGHILIATLVWFLVAWLFHKNMILGMTKSKSLERKDNRKLYDMVERLAISRGIPTPKLYIIEDDSMNAFASGLSPKNALISFSRGLLNNLTDQEIEAVAAHEMSHILNRDIRVMVISIIFVGIIQTVSEVFLRMRVQSRGGKDSGNAALVIFVIKIIVFLIGFLFTVMIQLAISRKREYLADAGAVELTKTSTHLISALKKISGDARIEAIENRNVAQMCIENPLEKKVHQHRAGIIDRLFSTHPPIQDRISVLESIG